MIRPAHLALLATASLLVAGCGGSTESPSPPAPSRPVISSFTAAPSPIDAGGSSTLSWGVSGATSLSIDHGVGTVTGTSTVVSPTSTTTFTLTATGAGGSATAQATVIVTSGSPGLEVACSGTSCGAVSPNRYSGSGIGVWRYRNPTGTPATIDIAIGGVSAGKQAVLVYSNGLSTPTTLPFPGTPASPVLPAERAVASGQVDPETEGEDALHRLMLERNRAVVLEPIGPRAMPGPSSPVGPAPFATPVIGATKSWKDTMPATPVAYSTVAKAICTLSTGRNAVFWVDPNATSQGYVTDADLTYFTTTFCGSAGGYASVVGQLGDAWGSGAAKYSNAIQDAPGALLDVNIAFLNVPTTTGWAGYFWGGNNTTNAPDSNKALVFMINASQVKESRNYVASTLLHELTHMVNFYQRDVSRELPGYDTWLEEMSAMMTEDIFTPNVTPDHYVKIGDQRIRPYLETGGGVSLVNWPGLASASGNYGLGGSLGAFLNRRYGFAVYSNMLDCADASTGCVDGLVKANGGTSFEDEFARCGVTLWGLFPGTGFPAGYGYPQATVGSLTVPSYDVSIYSGSRPATATPLGASFDATTHWYVADTISGTTYMRRGVVVPPNATLLLSIQ